MSGIVITITGPSCAGKTTLEGMLVREPGFSRVISHTTRPMRPNEKDGENYFFIDRERFEVLKKRGDFVETVEFGGNLYGASVVQFREKLEAGKNVVVVAEPEGRDQILQWAERNETEVLPIFLTNPANVIAQRFVERGATDMIKSIGKNDGSLDRALKAMAGRLDVMLAEEVYWHNVDHPNAITFGRFDRENERLVLGRIIQRASALSGVTIQ